MPKQTELASVPTEVDDVKRKRSVSLTAYLQRWVPYWGHPGWLNAQRWRSFVRNQAVAVVSRDTLVSNMLNMDWDIHARDPEGQSDKKVQKNIEYYKELFTGLEGDFDNYCELMAQDLLDLPFGAASEIVREDDDPEGYVQGMYHIDAASLFPTGIDEFPVQQRIPELPGVVVNFPQHAIARIMMTPRPEIKRKGWGMAPPEKGYLAIEMLFRGDKYYANLLLDTPEAGILDLIDMSAEDAEDWIEGFRSLFSGIDGFKVPVLHSHTKAAVWIPLNRPPIDMMYDKVTMKYAQLLTAAYGMRLSDIGMAELSGEKTLAGVIRGERQTRRSGFATLRTKFENHFNNVLPKELKFVWIDDDEETKLAESKMLVSFSAGLNSLTGSGLISREEARQEIVARGLLEIDIDPEELPEDPKEKERVAGQEFQMGQQVQGQKFKKGEREAGQKPGFPFGRQKEDDKKPASQGGRGGLSLKSLFRRGDVEEELPPSGKWEKSDLLEMMNQIIEPALLIVPQNANDTRIRRLIKATTRAMVPQVSRTFMALTDEQIEDYWLTEMTLLDWDRGGELDSLVMRQGIGDIHDELEKHLSADAWWSTATAVEKAQILRIYVSAYEVGLQDMALQIIRTLYEEGLTSTTILPIGIEFDLVNEQTITELTERAADLVRWVDVNTKHFIKRVITSGVRQGLSSPKIAQGIREGESAEWILSQDTFMDEAIGLIKSGLIDMTRARSESIVNTEINRAENQGKLGQMKGSGLESKRWVHLGERGETAKGNPHPCPLCEANEDLGFVPADYVYPTVFKTGGVDEKGGEYTPPGHPNVCHCTIFFDESELVGLVEEGKYIPYTGQ
ncbi:MAG: hypothetical protein ACC700_14065 [Anaerolineales bacterium]